MFICILYFILLYFLRFILEAREYVVLVVHVQRDILQRCVPVDGILPRLLPVALGAQRLQVDPSMGRGPVDRLHLDVVDLVGVGQQLLAQIARKPLQTRHVLFLRLGQTALVRASVAQPLRDDAWLATSSDHLRESLHFHVQPVFGPQHVHGVLLQRHDPAEDRARGNANHAGRVL